MKSPELLFEFNQGKTSQINPMFLKNKFLEIKSNYHGFMSIYTDGSKQEDKVACSEINRYETLSARLPDTCSIFTAEAIAINIAFMFIREINYIFRFPFSIKIITHNDHSNTLIQQILKRYFELSKTKTIIFSLRKQAYSSILKILQPKN